MIEFPGEYGNLMMLAQMQMFQKQFGDIVKLEGIWGRRPCVFIYTAEECEKMYRIEGPWPIRIAIETMKRYREKNPEIFHGQFGLTSRFL